MEPLVHETDSVDLGVPVARLRVLGGDHLDFLIHDLIILLEVFYIQIRRSTRRRHLQLPLHRMNYHTLAGSRDRGIFHLDECEIIADVVVIEDELLGCGYLLPILLLDPSPITSPALANAHHLRLRPLLHGSGPVLGRRVGTEISFGDAALALGEGTLHLGRLR